MIDTKALRQKILDMAIKGELVPQDPNDEPASVLLERIRKEKQQLIKEGKIKKDKKDSVIFKGDDNRYYENLPCGWTVCKLSIIANIFNGDSINEQEKAQKYYGNVTGYNYIGTKDVSFNHTINYENGVKIPYNTATAFKIAHKNTPLLCIEGGSAGRKIGILKEDVCFGNKLCAFETYGINSVYLFYFLQCSEFVQIFKHNTQGIIGGVSINTIKKLPFLLPPLAEQVRIVECIDKLFAQIDIIEQNQADIDALYEEFRKRTLNLAIQGKLVPQDPNDEPAGVLLERIRAERAKSATGKKGKAKPESIIYKNSDDNSYYEKVGEKVTCIDDEIPFDIPDNWAWTRLGKIITLTSGRDMEPHCYNANGLGIPYITGASNIVESNIEINRWTTSPCVISKKGDLLITCKGTIGAMAYNEVGDIHIARQIMAIRSQFIRLSYIKIFLSSYMETLQSNAKSMIPGISRDDITDALIPIPPITEQYRIMTRVEEIASQ